MSAQNSKKEARFKRKKRIRKRMTGTQVRPRLTVFRSAKHMYAQVIDDTTGRTIAQANSLEADLKNVSADEEKDGKKITAKMAAARMVGKRIAERAVENGVKQVVFDRNGFIYHGRVKAVSDGARESGLDF